MMKRLIVFFFKNKKIAHELSHLDLNIISLIL